LQCIQIPINGNNLIACLLQRPRSVDDIIRQFDFFFGRHLGPHARPGIGFAHAVAFHDAIDLKLRGTGNHYQAAIHFIAAGFDHERRIHNNNAIRYRLLQLTHFSHKRSFDMRMCQCIELRSLVGVGKDDLSQLPAIDLAIRRQNPRAEGSDDIAVRFRSGPQQSVHNAIGIDYMGAQIRKHAGDGAFARGNIPG